MVTSPRAALAIAEDARVAAEARAQAAALEAEVLRAKLAQACDLLDRAAGAMQASFVPLRSACVTIEDRAVYADLRGVSYLCKAFVDRHTTAQPVKALVTTARSETK